MEPDFIPFIPEDGLIKKRQLASKKIEFTDNRTPGIDDYSLYAKEYGQFPLFHLFTLDEEGFMQPRNEVPKFSYTDGLISSVIYDLAEQDFPVTGVFILE